MRIDGGAPATKKGPIVRGKPAARWKSGGRRPWSRWWLVPRAVLALLLLLTIGAYLGKDRVYRIYQLQSSEMEPTLVGAGRDADRIVGLIAGYLSYTPRRWDVVAVKNPSPGIRRHYDQETGTWRDTLPRLADNDVNICARRVVGLPGETVAVTRGDVWMTRQVGAMKLLRPSNKPYQAQRRHLRVSSDAEDMEVTVPMERLVKPYALQKNMWIAVYREDFADVGEDEFRHWWFVNKQGALALANGGLTLGSRTGPTVIVFAPWGRPDEDSPDLELFPGIVDRYLPRQTISFVCRAESPDGSRCGASFDKFITSQNIEARCPRCGSLQREGAAVRYARGHGLPQTRRHEGEALPDNPPRPSPYHIVPDLRVFVEASLDSGAVYTASLFDDGHAAQMTVRSDGSVTVADGGGTVLAAAAMPAFRKGVARGIEFHVADGMARVVVDKSSSPLMETALPGRKRRSVVAVPERSGVALGVEGGAMRIHSLEIDRDVYYFTGLEDFLGRHYRRDPDAQDATFIGGDSMYLLGDQALTAIDSRVWGPLPLSYLRSNLVMILLPYERMRFF